MCRALVHVCVCGCAGTCMKACTQSEVTLLSIMYKNAPEAVITLNCWKLL